jgi:phosphatidylserine/phosphatidylglycerophosphate/cardiolipin synthase-like enzyme
MTTGRGLSRVPLPVLEQLLAAFDRGRLESPLTAADIAEAGVTGFGDDVLDALRHVDAAGARAALAVAIAERVHRPPPRLELVWTGPESRASVARSTALVVERLFREAQRSVIVGGYAFDSPDVLRPLHAAMATRGVTVTIFMDVPAKAASRATAHAFATAFIDEFFRDVWTFGAPWPDVYFDPRTAAPGPPWVSLHAKCIVVDDERALVTSANFTDRGHERNIEAGVLIEDRAFSEELGAQWRQLVSAGLVKAHRR